jgi:O-antigen ligase
MIRYSVLANVPSDENRIAWEEVKPTNRKSEYPRSVIFLFLFFSLYLALPLIDVPLLGLSMSAPIFFLIALPVLVRPVRPWFAAYRRWLLRALAIWLGILVSAVLNGLFSGGTQIDREGLVSLVQFAYWLLVFSITVYIVSSQTSINDRLVAVIAFGIAVLGILRLGEAFLGDAVGAWTDLRIMTQNGYGIQFSMFYPVLLACVFWGPGRKLAGFAVLSLLAAILINGSRSGWLAALISTLIFLWMYLRTQQRRVGAVGIFFFLTCMVGLGSLLAPQVVVSAFEARLSSFQNLEEDKSYAIRQLMIQKGVHLFESSPWIGVGVSRWTKEYTPLEIPRILQYAGQEHFDTKSSHNSYVSFLAENGVVGAIPLALLLLILAVQGYGAASGLARRGQVWGLGIYAGFIGMSIHLWALSGLAGTATWFVYGLVAALIVLDRQAASRSEE